MGILFLSMFFGFLGLFLGGAIGGEFWAMILGLGGFFLPITLTLQNVLTKVEKIEEYMNQNLEIKKEENSNAEVIKNDIQDN